MRPGSAYCLSQCNKDEKAAFASQLYLLAQMTWGEIRKSSRHKLGFELIPQAGIHDPIPPRFQGSRGPQVAVFRFDGKKPMAGFIERDTFYIVWLDRDFSLYKH